VQRSLLVATGIVVVGRLLSLCTEGKRACHWYRAILHRALIQLGIKPGTEEPTAILRAQWFVVGSMQVCEAMPHTKDVDSASAITPNETL